MSISLRAFKRLCSGYTSTELLVALAAGAIVLSSVAIYAMSATRSYAQIVVDARVMRQITRVMDEVADAVRASGYHADAARYVPEDGNSQSSDSPVVRSPTCAIVRTDRAGTPIGTYRGFRFLSARRAGVIQTTPWVVAEPNCNASATGSGWRDMTDPDAVDVVDFSFAVEPALSTCATRRGFIVASQGLAIRISARATGADSSARTLYQVVSVRNNIMAAGNCL